MAFLHKIENLVKRRRELLIHSSRDESAVRGRDMLCARSVDTHRATQRALTEYANPWKMAIPHHTAPVSTAHDP